MPNTIEDQVREQREMMLKAQELNKKRLEANKKRVAEARSGNESQLEKPMSKVITDIERNIEIARVAVQNKGLNRVVAAEAQVIQKESAMASAITTNAAAVKAYDLGVKNYNLLSDCKYKLDVR